MNDKAQPQQSNRNQSNKHLSAKSSTTEVNDEMITPKMSKTIIDKTKEELSYTPKKRRSNELDNGQTKVVTEQVMKSRRSLTQQCITEFFQKSSKTPGTLNAQNETCNRQSGDKNDGFDEKSETENDGKFEKIDEDVSIKRMTKGRVSKRKSTTKVGTLKSHVQNESRKQATRKTRKSMESPTLGMKDKEFHTPQVNRRFSWNLRNTPSRSAPNYMGDGKGRSLKNKLRISEENEKGGFEGLTMKESEKQKLRKLLDAIDADEEMEKVGENEVKENIEAKVSKRKRSMRKGSAKKSGQQDGEVGRIPTKTFYGNKPATLKSPTQAVPCHSECNKNEASYVVDGVHSNRGAKRGQMDRETDNDTSMHSPNKKKTKKDKLGTSRKQEGNKESKDVASSSGEQFENKENTQKKGVEKCYRITEEGLKYGLKKNKPQTVKLAAFDQNTEKTTGKLTLKSWPSWNDRDSPSDSGSYSKSGFRLKSAEDMDWSRMSRGYAYREPLDVFDPWYDDLFKDDSPNAESEINKMKGKYKHDTYTGFVGAHVECW